MELPIDYQERTKYILSRGKLACTDFLSGAIRVVFTYSKSLNRKEPLLLALVLDQTLVYVKGHVPKLDLAIVQAFKINPAIVRVYQSNLAIVQVLKQTSIAGYLNNTACLLAGIRN